jgi:hypothetical protein
VAEGLNQKNLNCEEYTKLASQRLEVQISLQNRLRMLWHRFICVYCRRFSRQLAQMRKLLHRAGAERPMPEPMKTRLRKKLAQIK